MWLFGARRITVCLYFYLVTLGFLIKFLFKLYLCRYRVHIGVKWSQNLQGIKTNWFGALLSSQNRKICKKLKKRWKNAHFLAVFRSFFRFGWKVAHQTKMSSFVGVFCFFWHPKHPCSITNSADIIVYSFIFQILKQ